jgi:hypothetical protein
MTLLLVLVITLFFEVSKANIIEFDGLKTQDMSLLYKRFVFSDFNKDNQE